MKKLLALALAAGLVLVALSGVVLADTDSDFSELPVLPEYMSITGTVEAIHTEPYIIDIEDRDGNPAKLVISDGTVFPFDESFSVGDTVTGFYLANAPMILIWPPQYTTAVLAAGVPDATFFRVDRFRERDHSDEYLFNTDDTFGFRVGDETEVILANGDDFSDGELAGRRLVVIFDVSTRSMPELATATKVIVLYEDAVPLPSATPDIIVDVPLMPIIVDSVLVGASPAFLADDDATIMVPLRAIAEALGFEVTWDGASRSVLLGDAATLRIGNPVYSVGGSELVIDGASAPLLRNNLTFVPLQFFSFVLDMPSASVAGGQIAVTSS